MERDTVPVLEDDERAWIAKHLRELADRVQTDLEIVAVEARWNVFDGRYEVKLTHREEDDGGK